MAGSPVFSLSGDPAEQARLLARVREAVLSGADAPAPPRTVISESWRRSLAAKVDPDARPPSAVYAADELRDVRAGHPLAQVLPLLRSTLVSVADEAMHVMIVTDAEGNILWCEGASDVRSRAETVGLHEGTRWSEAAMGTNAMGTTLAVDAPVQVFSAEHLVHAYQGWTCAAAPVHDPDTGKILGAIDISGPLHTAHPAMVSLMTATAQLAEGQLRVRMLATDERLRARNMHHLDQLRGEGGALLTPTGRVLASQPGVDWPVRVDPTRDRVTLADGTEALIEPLAEGYLLRVPGPHRSMPRKPLLRLRFLGEHPGAELDGRPLPLTTRRAELLALLVLFPAGLSAEQLALYLYGEEGNPTSARAEIHRLRSQLGAAVVRTKPYRLCADVDADFREVAAALRSGEVRVAAESCPGPLLPGSDSPTIRAESEDLVAVLRRAVIDRGDAEALWALAESTCGRDDLELHELLCGALAEGDPRLAIAFARRHRLRSEE